MFLKSFSFLALLLTINADVNHYRFRRQTSTGNTCPLPTGATPCDFGSCQNGADCESNFNDPDCVKCNCAVGFTGKFCQSEIINTGNGCNPSCQNGGTCNGNTCVCNTGFTGTSCEFQNVCIQNNPCQNNGRCISNANSFTCNCDGTGFTGPTCSERIIVDPCASNPCQNNGQCSTNANGLASCSCVNGFLGEFCQIAPIPCASLPCRNNGTCNSAGNNYTCTCTVDYTGKQCETFALSIHPCVTSPATTCQNGATCTRNGDDYVCRCAPGWIGTNCEVRQTISVCDPNPCGTNGDCVLATLPTQTLAVCVCHDRWTGKYCDVNMDLTCTANYCQNGGTCQSNGNSLVCLCPSMFTGLQCEQPIGSNTTSNSSTTTSTTTTTTTLSSTATPIITCAAKPCLNSGTCYNNANGFFCLCTPQYSGRVCDSATNVSSNTTSTTTTPTAGCSPNPCQNSGTCYRNGNSYVCVCQNGYSGLNCTEIRTTTVPNNSTSPPRVSCNTQPCLNGGSCFNTANSYYCYCRGNFTGQNCERSA